MIDNYVFTGQIVERVIRTGVVLVLAVSLHAANRKLARRKFRRTCRTVRACLAAAIANSDSQSGDGDETANALVGS